MGCEGAGKMTLDELLQPGHSFHVYYNKGNRNNRLYHVRAVVDGEQIVTRCWSYIKGRWVYAVNEHYWYKTLADSDHIPELLDS